MRTFRSALPAGLKGLHYTSLLGEAAPASLEIPRVVVVLVPLATGR